MRRDLIGVAVIALMGLPTVGLAADTATTGVENPAVATSPGEESKGKPHIPEASPTDPKGPAADAMATSPGEENKGKPPMAPQ